MSEDEAGSDAGQLDRALLQSIGTGTPNAAAATLGGSNSNNTSTSTTTTPSIGKKKNSTGAGRVQLSSKNGPDFDTSQRMQHSLFLGGKGGAAAAATAAGVAAAEAEKLAGDAGAKTADRIREEIAREPVLSLANLAGFAEGPTGSEEEGSGVGVNPDVDEEEEEEEGEDEELGIPKSIAEIYEVSFFNWFKCFLLWLWLWLWFVFLEGIYSVSVVRTFFCF